MKSCRTCISIIVTLCLVITPLVSHGQRPRSEESEQQIILQAKIDAIAHAKIDTDFVLWYSMGCLFLYVGVGAAYLIVPSSSYERLLGKPMDYVQIYQESYRSTRRSLQTRYAIYGCLTNISIVALAIIIAESQEDEIECFPRYDWSR